MAKYKGSSANDLGCLFWWCYVAMGSMTGIYASNAGSGLYEAILAGIAWPLWLAQMIGEFAGPLLMNGGG